jgi:transposase
MTIYCGIDWSERHHDVAIVDDTGATLATRRITDDAAGLTVLLTLLAEHVGEPPPGVGVVPVDVALETGRGLLVAALRAAGHRLFEINPKAASRYRDRHAVSGAKSDPGDALVLAHLLRTDRDRHRPMPVDSEQVTVIGVLARAHQDAVAAAVRDSGRLRSLLREFFPAALTAFPTLHIFTATTVLAAAPTPAAAAQLSEARLRELMRAARYNTPRGGPARLRAIFTAPQLRQPAAVEAAMGQAVVAIVRTLAATLDSIRELEKALDQHFEQHPDAEILRSLPGLGLVLGARVLGEFGDDPTRFIDAASRRAYAGSAPITRASGKLKLVLLRRACNHRLSVTCRWWAHTATQRSPGAKAYYQRRRAAGDTREAALRRVANKLLGQLHHCLSHRELYDEHRAWPAPQPHADNAA